MSCIVSTMSVLGWFLWGSTGFGGAHVEEVFPGVPAYCAQVAVGLWACMYGV